MVSLHAVMEDFMAGFMNTLPNARDLGNVAAILVVAVVVVFAVCAFLYLATRHG
jgi:hypothetical protein